MRALKARRLVGSAVLTALVLAARFFPLAPLRDAATGAVVPAAGLSVSWLGVALSPFCALADAASCQSARQDIAFLTLLLVLGAGWFRFFVFEEELSGWFSPARALKALGVWTLLVAAFCAWTALGPRPAEGLVLQEPDALAVDFHSHTSASWDARKWFTPSRSIERHTGAGFAAFFVTDHNVFEGSREAHAQSLLAREAGRAGAQALLGEELSLSGAHVVVLGNRALVDSSGYSDGEAGLRRFLGRHPDTLAVMSLPEYARYHWAQLEQIPDWGADGFELIAASPRGLELSAERRARVVSLCEARGLFMTSATDDHGWGGPPCAWSVLRLPGWRALDADALEAAVLARLREARFSAVQVLVRSSRVEPAPDAGVWLDPARGLWRAARAWSLAQALAAVVWMWVFPMAFSRFRL